MTVEILTIRIILERKKMNETKLEEIGKIEFSGDIKKDEDISAIVSFGDFLAIGSDESKRKIQILQKAGEGYEVKDDLEIKLPVLAEEYAQEVDIEGMSIGLDKHGNYTLFVIGSHSLRRLKVKKDDETYLTNRERITRVIQEDKKNSIFRLTLDPQTGEEIDKDERITIRIKDIIENDSILGVFTGIPSKENGVDIEGIASEGETLYIGFRGPVLRENYVPVMVIREYDKTSEYELRFVNLGGNGIRDITKVEGGFLILTGPVGDGLGPYQLYFWDGKDCIPGNDKTEHAELTCLVDIPIDEETDEGADEEDEEKPTPKAEGITVLEESASDYTVLVVYDGVKNGRPTLFKIDKLKP